MDFSLSTLGCSLLPSLGMTSSKRRHQAPHTNVRQQSPEPQEEQSCSRSSPSTTNNTRAECHRESFLVYLERSCKISLCQQQYRHKELDHEDDDTATTLSSSSSEDEKMVTFCDPLVTAVYTRPMTSKEDKYYLHYSHHDYVDFKVEYMTGRQRNRRVSFARETQVHQVQPVAGEKTALYYSEAELQEFLDEFVHSLNQRFD